MPRLGIHRDADRIAIERLTSASNLTAIDILLELLRRSAETVLESLGAVAESRTVRVNRDTLIACAVRKVSSIVNLEHRTNLARSHGVAASKISNKRIKSIRHNHHLSKHPFNNVVKLGLLSQHTCYYIITNPKSKLLRMPLSKSFHPIYHKISSLILADTKSIRDIRCGTKHIDCTRLTKIIQKHIYFFLQCHIHNLSDAMCNY